MSDQVDLGDWFLASPEHDSYQLPPNISDSSLWNNLPLMDINIPNDQPTQLDNLSPIPIKSEAHFQKQVPISTVTDDVHLNTSPITTRIDPISTPNASSYRPPLAQLNALPRSAKKTPIQKSITKAAKLPDFQLDSRHHPAQKTAKQTPTRAKKLTPKRTPNRRPKVEVPLLSPLLGSKGNAANKSPSQKRAPDESRERHNKMMRENRHRFNNKFKELTDLLDTFKEPGCEYKPMKNKIQILERAIYQYAQMQTKRARYENELMFSSEHLEEVKNEFLRVFIAVPSLPDACNLVIQNMCASLNWKYGEAWVRKSAQGVFESPCDQYELCTSVVSKNNMPDTRLSLDQFLQKSKASSMDNYLLTLSQHRHPVWIPNLSEKTGKSSRAVAAKEAGITTMFTVPIYFGEDPSELPDAVITLMHVNDELLSYPRDERPYDSKSTTKLLDLVSAVVKSRAKMAC